MAVLTLDVAVKKFAEKINLGIAAVVERLALDIFNRITERTPVDTGRARQSWQVTIGEVGTFVPPSLGKGTGANKGKDTPPQNPVAVFPTDINIDGKQPVFITSALVYMEKLENGSSTQAPAGMVRLAIAEVEAEIEAILADLNDPK